MKNKSILLLCLLVWGACKNSNRASIKTDFPIAFIKKQAKSRVPSMNMEEVVLEKLVPIDSIFFKKWIAGQKVNDISDFTIEFNRYYRYYFFDFQDTEKVFLFTILEDDEVGYNNLFHFMFDKDKKKIAQVNLISQTGSDGGISDVDFLSYNSPHILIRTTVTKEEEDITDGVLQNYDSVITKIEFLLPKTVYSILDSYHFRDTISNSNPIFKNEK